MHTQDTRFETDRDPWDDYGRVTDPVSPATIANTAAIIEYLDWQLTVRHRRETTMTAYGSILSKFAEWVFPQSLWTVTVPQMEGFVVRPRNGRVGDGMGAAGTQKRDVAILRSFYLWAWERNYTADHIAKGLHAPQVRNVDPKPIPDEHWLKLWLNPELGPSDVVALGLGYYAGLRREEIYRLLVSNVTPTELVQFTRKGNKVVTLPWRMMLEVAEKRLPHLSPNPTRLTDAMAHLCRGTDGMLPLLRWACLEESSFNKKLHKWCNHLSIPRYSPHQLRHSTATNLVRSGMPMPMISQLMAHENVQTTMRYVSAGSGSALVREWIRDLDATR
jgi:site-specific recombinase XerD